jgi:hypothetical protein
MIAYSPILSCKRQIMLWIGLLAVMGVIVLPVVAIMDCVNGIVRIVRGSGSSEVKSD